MNANLISIPLLNDEQRVILETADAICFIESDLALRCRLSLYVVHWTYFNSKEKDKKFLMNPLNTFAAMLMQKSLEKSSIDLFSVVDDLVSKLKIDRKLIIGMNELKNHRHYQSHVYMEKFDHRSVKEFIESGLHRKDDIALRVWQVRSTILQIMKKNEINVNNVLNFDMSTQQAELINDIFRLSSVSGEQISPEVFYTMSKYFSAALTGIYANEFQKEFIKIYSEGPFWF